jgi:Uma2 family endonuclease
MPAIHSARKLTFADLDAASGPGRPTPELIDGEITSKASPRATHSYVQGTLREEVRAQSRQNGGGWWILVEPDVVFAEDTLLRPDLAGWRVERLPTLGPSRIDVVPDWVCELLSPGHERYDRVTKLGRYALYGVPFVWLVHPDERYVEAFELRHELWLRLGAWTDGALVRIPPFPDLTIDVSRLFVPPPPVAHEPDPSPSTSP